MPEPADALRRVNERMKAACERAGRSPESVRLVAVSKTVSPERIRRLIDAGHDLLGENRVQEALRKQQELGAGARWHFVGHLQRNKARHAVGAFELIHSVDNVELAREMDKRAGRADTTQAVLVQVNVSREATKHGVGERALFDLVEGVAGLPRLKLSGLMTIPPPAEHADDSREYFVRLRELRDECERLVGARLPELSMGMTDDFEVAIEEGATLVRVGRAIFGERPERERETDG